jgi:hypothetical protein
MSLYDIYSSVPVALNRAATVIGEVTFHLLIKLNYVGFEVIGVIDGESVKNQSTFRKNMFHSSSRSKNKRSKKTS